MKILRLALVLVFLITGCNPTGTRQQLKDNNINTTKVSNEGNIGKGQQYGGKGTGYGQVKKIPPGQAVPPLIEAPPAPVAPIEIKTFEDLQKAIGAKFGYTVTGKSNLTTPIEGVYDEIKVEGKDSLSHVEEIKTMFGEYLNNMKALGSPYNVPTLNEDLILNTSSTNDLVILFHV
jgi:hypothetical protein